MNGNLLGGIADRPMPDSAPDPTSTLSDSLSDPTSSPTNPAPKQTPKQTPTPPPDPSPKPTTIPTPNSAPNHSKRRQKPITLRDRFLDIFPPGIESNSGSITTRAPYQFAPHQLHDKFFRDRGGQDAARIVVRSAWYGKQIRSAKHEFIVIHVEDPAIPGLKNCMAIDRNRANPDANVATASSSRPASDTFKVAYDGDMKRLLQESHLTSYLELEELSFPDAALPLQKLVVLVNHISIAHRRYNPMDTNCYWFTGLIWECMLNMCLGVQHVITPARRGRISYLRFVPNPVQVRNVLRAVQEEIETLDSESSSSNHLANASVDDMAGTASLASAETDMIEYHT